MKEKIIEILEKFKAPCKYGITSSEIALAASEIAAVIKDKIPTEQECKEWLDKVDFGYGTQYLHGRAGARMGIEWFRSRIKGEGK
jgi:hypothetical protein